jgi:hypothetical protein
MYRRFDSNLILICFILMVTENVSVKGFQEKSTMWFMSNTCHFFSLLGDDALSLGRWFLTFRKIVVPSSSKLSLLGICLEGLRKTTKLLRRKIRYAGQDSGRTPSECRSDSLPPEPSSSVFQCCSRLVPVISNHCALQG